MKANDIKKQVNKKPLTIDEKRTVAKKNLPLIKEAIIKYGKKSAA